MYRPAFRVVRFTPQALYYLGKCPRYPLDGKLGGPLCRSGRRGEVKILDHTGTRPLGRSASSRSLYRLSLAGSVRDIIYQESQNTTFLETEETKYYVGLHVSFHHIITDLRSKLQHILSINEALLFMPRRQ
jgi:hypothetical protein